MLSALFAFTTLASRDNSSVATIGGVAPLVVKSDSMKPTFSAGDLIIIKKCNKDNLKVGDIVTFHTIIENEYALNTHRITEIDEINGVRSYTTKGDNNAVSDVRFISDGDIVGQYVFSLPKFGKVMDFLSGSVGFLLIIVLPMVLFLIYQVYHLVMVSMRLKRAMAVENAEQKGKEDNKQVEEAMAEAERVRLEAEAALAEAKRLKEEAQAQMAASQQSSSTEGTVAEEKLDSEPSETTSDESEEAEENEESSESEENE